MHFVDGEGVDCHLLSLMRSFLQSYCWLYRFHVRGHWDVDGLEWTRNLANKCSWSGNAAVWFLKPLSCILHQPYSGRHMTLGTCYLDFINLQVQYIEPC